MVLINRQLLIGLLCISVLVSQGWAQVTSDGTSGAVMLTFPGGARALGMGEASVSMGGDLPGLYYNPASVAGVDAPGASVFYEGDPVDGALAGCMLVYPTSVVTFAGGVRHYSLGHMALTTADGTTRSIEGENDYVVMLSFAGTVSGRLRIGASAKMLHSTLVEEFTATSAMLDVGCLIRLLENRLSLGASVQNLGEPLKYVDVGDPLPRVVRIGASTSIRLMRQPVTVALDVVRWRGENVNTIHIILRLLGNLSRTCVVPSIVLR